MTSPARVDDNDEGTPFLQIRSDDTPYKPTPLPTAQVSVLLLPWIAEAIVSHSISPYINQLVRDLPIVGGDVRKVGYYTGIIVSLHYASEAATVLCWTRLSDYIGRKPVLLCCLAGTAASIVLFGFSRTFATIIFSRCLHGAMKGNIGVVKSAMAEITDETNAARGFSLIQMSSSVGYVIGPLIGGTLSRPADRWPRLFSNIVWVKYPYLLPCLVAAIHCCVLWVITALFLRETITYTRRINSDILQEEEPSDTMNASRNYTEKPPPLRALLTQPVLLSVANYAMVALLEMVCLALIPLVWSTSVEFGGLGLSPVSIGSWLSVYGCMDGIFQFAVFPRVVWRFGLRRVFITCIASCAVVIIMFPLENFVLRHGGSTMALRSLIFVQLLSYSTLRMGYCAVLMYSSSAVPSNRSLGAVNGLARTVASIECMFGPVVADSLFAFSITNNVLGGNFVYVVLLTLVWGGLYLAAKLPRHMWTYRDR